jgi:decaprenylphospho-beta-D-erythro-pentofuranosid-2-ulose 2-reductase
MSRILIIGATSAIAQAFARMRVSRGDELFLVARDIAKLQILAADLHVRGAQKVGTLAMDANDFDQHGAMFEAARAELGGVGTVLIAHGALGDQRAGERDFRLAEQAYKTNFLSVVSMLTPISGYFEAERRGTIAVISSVAGDRGRQSNFIYGSAKAGLSVYLAGLRNRLHPSGVTVLTIKPGFVDTPMTAHLPKGALFASPEKVARDVSRALDKGRDLLYTPAIWFWIMAVVRLIPETVFKRLKL